MKRKVTKIKFSSLDLTKTQNSPLAGNGSCNPTQFLLCIVSCFININQNLIELLLGDLISIILNSGFDAAVSYDVLDNLDGRSFKQFSNNSGSKAMSSYVFVESQ